MSRSAYNEINLHITWHVKDHTPVLKDDIEYQLRRFLRKRAMQEPGVFWHDVGGTDNHIHLLASIPPTLFSSEWIGRLKGASSHHINHTIANRKTLQWQAGYGVLSFGTKDLPWVLRYVRTQRAHHARGTVNERLERVESDEDKKPAEEGSEGE